MSKTAKTARPRKGGSYTRDPDTGKLKRTQFTRPGQAEPQAPQDEPPADPPADPENKEA